MNYKLRPLRLPKWLTLAQHTAESNAKLTLAMANLWRRRFSLSRRSLFRNVLEKHISYNTLVFLSTHKNSQLSNCHFAVPSHRQLVS